jgi:uncharacterized protein
MNTGLDRSDNSIEVLSEQQCRDLLAAQNLGRIAFSIVDQPQVFPVNYAADGTVVVFRTAADNRLQQAVLRRVNAGSLNPPRGNWGRS